MQESLDILVLTPPGLYDPALAIAAVRAGAVGLLDLGATQPQSNWAGSLRTLQRHAGDSQSWGVAWDLLGEPGRMPRSLRGLAEDRWPWLLLAGVDFQRHELEEVIRQGREVASRVAVEAYSLEDAVDAEEAGFDGVVLKGEESGARIGRQSTFLLLQRARDRLTIPYWARGGISPHTAASAVVAGASGVVLCEQLWLARESPLAGDQRRRWERLDGSETVTVGDDRHAYRFFARSARPTLEDLARKQESGGQWLDALRHALTRPVGPDDRPGENVLMPMGQEIAFAAGLARSHVTTGGVVAAFRKAMRENPVEAGRQRALDEGSPLARKLGTRYPIVQGPMSRVSDVVPFGQSVSRSGGMPVFALALLRKPEAQRLLGEAKVEMADRPWGVGLLGFVPKKLRSEQLEAIAQTRPSFAIIAGGRPSQAAELEALGVSTYLHVPSPGLLEGFVREGARKFVLEGRECGGHVGPRSSFTLWSSAIEVLLGEEVDDPSEFEVLFAGGIHDRHSAAMTAVAAAPLVERGVKVGALVGTAYLFTHEAVTTGAVTAEFQRQAITCRQTTLLYSGLGHASRCAVTPFAEQFKSRRRELAAADTSPEQTRLELEMLNLGRLRLAAKGLKRRSGDELLEANPDAGLIHVSNEEQRRDGMFMIGEVATLVDQTRSMAQLHDDVCHGSARLLEGLVPQSERTLGRGKTEGPREPLAIVGISCLFPDCEDLRQYWQSIVANFSAIREVPKDRWDADVLFCEDRLAADRVYSKWGAFLGDIRFDPTKYRIPPAVLEHVEPIQLLSLEVARRALEDAGYFERAVPGDRTAVIFGIAGPHEMGMSYGLRTMLRQRLAEADELPEDVRGQVLNSMEARLPKWTEDSFAGFLNNVVAGRISNLLDLGGPNFVVDAACAGSLAAVHVAAEQLRAGVCDAALVGGADATNNPCGFMSFAATHALSPRGKSSPFDDRADGIVLGEGVAAMVLKRLSDAERDGDRIYAVLRGIGTGSDGRNRSLTAPHAPGQLRTLRRAYADAGISPSDVSLIEAHGTGTAVGDRVEVEALKDLLGQSNMPPGTCAVGSVKSMIGHTKAAAGIAGLIKAAMALKQKVLPPTNNVDKPNSQIDFSRGPFYVNAETRPWIRSNPEQPRCAGVSAFGFGGTNFHVVLEEYAGEYYPGLRLDLAPRACEVFFFAAADREQLVQRLQKLDAQLERTPNTQLAQLAYSVLVDNRVQRKPKRQACRLAIVAANLADLRKKLRMAIAEVPKSTSLEHRSGIYLDFSEGVGDRAVAFVIPGQGAQQPNMLRDLALLHPDGTAIFEQADRLLESSLERPLSSYIYPVPAFSEEDRARQKAEVDDTRIAQPALSAMGLFAVDLLRRFNLRADFAAGHSHGEYVALWVAGCLSADDLVQLSAKRGEVVSRTCQSNPGAMAVVFADQETTEAALRELEIPAQVANLNAPNNTTIAGPVGAIERAVEELSERKLRVRRIPVTAAFHTGSVQPAADELASVLEKIEFTAAQIPVYSNVTAGAYPEDSDAMRELLAQQLVRPVRFVEQIRRMYEDGARVFIEVGPGNTATNFMSRILDGKPHHAIPIDMKDRAGGAQLAHVLARCTALGLPVDLEPWFAGRRLTRSATAEYLAQVEADGEIKPTDWIVSGNRARPARSAAERSQGSQGGQKSRSNQGRRGSQSSKSSQSSQKKPKAAAPKKTAPADNGAGRIRQSTRSRGRKTVSTTPQHRDQPPSVFSGSNGRGGGPSLEGGNGRVKDSFLFRPSGGNGKLTSSTVPEQENDARSSSATSVASVSPPIPSISIPGQAPGPAPSAGSMAAQPVSAEALAQFQANMAQWLQSHRQLQEANQQFLELQQQVLRVIAGGGPATVPMPAAVPAAAVPADTPGPVGAGPSLPQPLPSGRSDPAPGVGPAAFSGAGAAPRVSEPARSRIGTVAEPEMEPEVEADDEFEDGRVPTTEEFRQDLLGAASERTGYPVEMLEEDLLLEADLGIDSIKRIEIFNGLKKYYAFTQYKDRSEEEILNTFTSLKTLGDIVATFDRERTDYLALQAGGATDNADSADSTEVTVNAPGAEPFETEETPRPFEQTVPAAQREEQSSMAPEPSLENVDSTVERFVVRPKRAPLAPDAGQSPLVPAGQTVLVLGRIPKWEPEWTAAIAGDEHGICEIVPGKRAARLAPDRYEVDFSSAESVAALADLLREAGVRVGGIVNLLGLEEPFSRPGTAGAAGDDDLAFRLTESLFNVARQFEEEFRARAKEGAGRLINVTALGGTFGIGTQRDLPLAQAVSLGFFKSLAREWPQVRVKNIDLDLTADPRALQAALVAEMRADDNSREVGLGRQGRRTMELVEAPLANENLGRVDLDRESVVLVTGGARGITAEIARALAERYGCRLVMAGRTPEPAEEPPELRAHADEQSLRDYLVAGSAQDGKRPKPAEIDRMMRPILRDREVRGNLAALRATGATVEYHAVDVRRAEALTRWIDQVYRQHARIDGVIHAAGVIEDMRIRDKTAESLARVLRTKVDAANVLAANLKPEALKFFFLFSSVAGRFGNAGQADYAAANEYLSKLAGQLDARWPSRVVAIQWGPWDRGVVDPGLIRLFALRDIRVIPTPEGVGAFDRELRAGDRHAAEVVLACNVRRLEAVAKGAQ